MYFKKKISFPLKWILVLGLSVSPSYLLAQGNVVEGSFLLRNTSVQVQVPLIEDVSTYSQLYLKGEFQSSNQLKSQIHFLSSQNYGETILTQELFQVFPSVHWLISESIELQIGRNFYENKSSHLSKNSFERTWHSLDGLILGYTSSLLDFDLWSAYLPERWVAQETKKEFDYGFGFFLDIDMDSFYIDSFHFQVSYLSDSFLVSNSKKMSRYGFSMKGTVSDLNITYKFSTIGHGSGLAFKLEEQMYHGHLQYKKSNFFDSAVSVGYHVDTPNYNPWLYNRHEKAGHSDFLQWKNLKYYFIKAQFSPMTKLFVTLMFLDFYSSKKGNIDLGYFGSLIHENKSELPVSQENLAQEVNLKIQSEISKSLDIQFLTALFLTQSDILSKKNKRLYNNMQLSAFYKF